MIEFKSLENKNSDLINERDSFLQKLSILEDVDNKNKHSNDQECQTTPDSKQVERMWNVIGAKVRFADRSLIQP